MYELIDELAKPKTSKTPNGEMLFTLGNIETMVMGGPFEYYNDHLAEIPGFTGVLMAEELQHMSHGVCIPTKDFNVPHVTQFRIGLVQSIALMAQGNLIYVGCMGGIGRTGLYMAALAKLMGEADPVKYVRDEYLPSAVETPDQQAFIKALYLKDIAKWARTL